MSAPVAVAEMLVRRPAAEVFQACVDPAITTRFWFTKGSGALTPAARVRWEWEMYGVVVDVVVRGFEQDRLLLFDWGGADEPPTQVEWRFVPHPEGTFVKIRNDGFTGTDDERTQAAIDSAGGFTIVLAGLKAWLEHGLELNLIADRFPPDAQ